MNLVNLIKIWKKKINFFLKLVSKIEKNLNLKNGIDNNNFLVILNSKKQIFYYSKFKKIVITLSSGAVLRYLKIFKKSLKYSNSNLLIILNILKKNKNLLNLLNKSNNNFCTLLLKPWNFQSLKILNIFNDWKLKNLNLNLNEIILQPSIKFNLSQLKKKKTLKKRLKKRIIKIDYKN